MTNLEYLREALASGFIEIPDVRAQLALDDRQDWILPLAEAMHAERSLSRADVRTMTRMIANAAIYMTGFAYPDDAERFETIMDESTAI
jgi:hypothetical protein